MLEAVTLAGNAEQVREEVAELLDLAEEAKAVEHSGSEAKLEHLREIMGCAFYLFIRAHELD